ncbi:Cytochrome c oxidase subunit 6A1, mitochondrial [Rhizophlyctis rosea]|uniref:Cytochrome c oxidase subunit 6A1, mitochondrial n=1 Tax=Rhizophlyctis rosea TaxID=64517 RepID=A0AAD5X1X6_9FUNG|nr:Cytochrome c oxidase subunit 6A1, mitochondrial [Rhizophlyctis rosea]
MNRIGLIRRTATAVQRRQVSSLPADKFPPIEKVMLKDAYEARHHAEEAVSLWKKINWFLVLPALLAVTYFSGSRELHHLAHLKEHPNEYVPWPHLRKRKNAFPWGDDSLFHMEGHNARPPREEEE